MGGGVNRIDALLVRLRVASAWHHHLAENASVPAPETACRDHSGIELPELAANVVRCANFALCEPQKTRFRQLAEDGETAIQRAIRLLEFCHAELEAKFGLS